jgi:hypothetical protein
MIRQWTDRAERRETALFADVAGPTSPSFQTRVRNISTTGMLIDAPDPVAVGDILIAQMPGGCEVMCAVVRRRAGTVGIRFVRAISERELHAWTGPSGAARATSGASDR